MKVLWWLQNDINWHYQPIKDKQKIQVKAPSTSVLWLWWHPQSLWCDAGPSPSQWSCQCHRSRCQWSPPCQQCWGGRKTWPHWMWFYLSTDSNVNSFPNVQYYFSVHLWLGEITFTVLLPSNQPEKLTLGLQWRCTVLTYVSCWSKTLLEFPALCSNWSLLFTQSNSVSHDTWRTYIPRTFDI